MSSTLLTLVAPAGVLLVALFPTRRERNQWRRNRPRLRALMAYYRAPWSRALLPGGALVAPFQTNDPEMGNE